MVSDFIMPKLNGLELYDALVTGNAPMVNKLDDPQIVLDAVRLAVLRAEG